MNTVQIPRVVIAGTNSGVGKTTIVAGLLAAYANGGRTVQSFIKLHPAVTAII